MRGAPRHHLSSKVLCWTALDRAVQLAPRLGTYAKPDAWAAERDRIRDAVLTRGWSETRGAYAQSFDSDELDAAALLMPLVGFLPATDTRMRATIEVIASELTDDGLVLRYRSEDGLNADGLTGKEGTFVICSFWLASCLAQAGEIPRAQALFDRLCGFANDVGLLAEEIDSRSGELLGNFPPSLQPHRIDQCGMGDRSGSGALWFLTVFLDALVNLYTGDIEAAIHFYGDLLGFEETFRTPTEGVPEHVELRLSGFTIGLGTVEAARRVHGVEASPGAPAMVIVVWTDDVDASCANLAAAGVAVVQAPHNTGNSNRNALLRDPDGNLVELVAKIA